MTASRCVTCTHLHIGSPFQYSLTSSNPELSQSILSGDGLQKAIAGTVSTIRIKFVDQFNNTALPGPEFKFGMALVKANEKVNHAEPREFQGEWEGGETGVYQMKYTATDAGNCKLHVWCVPSVSAKNERISFPGSPFSLHVSPGAPSTDVSQVAGWTKMFKEEKNAKYGKAANADPNTLIAGDTITIRPEVFDEFNNPTVLAEGSLSITHETPDGASTSLRYNHQNVRGTELVQYDVRLDTMLSGSQHVHVRVSGVPIKGSPVTFNVQPDKPEPQTCKLYAPETENGGTLYIEEPYKCLLRTYDRYGNHCSTGTCVWTCSEQVPTIPWLHTCPCTPACAPALCASVCDC